MVNYAPVILSMPTHLAMAVPNHSDRGRALVDLWSEHNIYCPNCSSPALKHVDSQIAGGFCCPDCEGRFRVTGQSTPFGKSVDAGEFDATTRALRNGRLSGCFFLHYDARSWTVRDLLLVPLFAIPEPAIARRGSQCHIVLDQVPAEARIAMITTIKSASPGGTECIMISRAEEVREKFRRLKPRRGKRAHVAA